MDTLRETYIQFGITEKGDRATTQFTHDEMCIT